MTGHFYPIGQTHHHILSFRKNTLLLIYPGPLCKRKSIKKPGLTASICLRRMPERAVDITNPKQEGYIPMKSFDLFNPTEEHAMLRQTIRDFVREQVEPQALEHDR